MIRRLKSFKIFSREIRGMHEAAYLLAIFSLGSQLLALVRDRLLAAAFGAGHTLDLYYAAFRVPDFIFATVASLFSIYALLPILSRLEKESEGLMVSFLRDMLGVFFIGMTSIALVAFAFAPVLAELIAPGIASDPVARLQLIALMRILLLQPILLGASNTVAALTQMRHRFILYSISPLLYNLGIIFGAIVLYPLFGITGLGWGVVIGAFLHMAVQLPFFISEKPHGNLSFTRMLAGIREVLGLSIPRTLALASTQISLFVITAMASFLVPGSITVFMFAYNLQAVPLTIIGVSYSVAAFPTLARFFAQGQRQEFVDYIEAALRHILFWSIPAMVFMIVLRAQIVRIILGAGQFDWGATKLTAAALALFILSLSAQSITLLIARAYYASGNTRKPLYYGCVDIVVSISSAYLLAMFFNQNLFFREFVEALLRVDDVQGTTVLMLALGYALGSVGEFIVGYVYFLRDFSIPSKRLGRLSMQSFAASVLGGAVAYQTLSIVGFNFGTHTTLAIIAEGTTAGLAGIIVTVMVLALLKNQELSEAYAALIRKFRDISPVALEPSDAST